MSLAKNIKTLRKKHKLTQDEFGDLFGVTRSSVSKWELDKSEPTFYTVQKIAEFFNVSVEELTGKSPKPNLTNNINLGRAKLSIQQTSVISKKNRLVFIVPLINVALSLLIISSLLVVLVTAYNGNNSQDNKMKLTYSNVEFVSLKVYESNKVIYDEKMKYSFFNRLYYINRVAIHNENFENEPTKNIKITIIVNFHLGYSADLSRSRQLFVATNNYLMQDNSNVYPYMITSGYFDFQFYINNEVGYLEAYLSK